jgi:hypothetical protein
MPTTPITAETMKQCFDQVLPALKAIPDNEVKKPRVSIDAAASLVLGAIDRLEPYLDDLARLFPNDANVVKELRTRAFAMLYAWVDNRTALPAPAELPPLVAEGLALRQRLLLSAEVMVAEGAIPAASVAEIRAGSGHLDVGTDLLNLAKLLGRNEKALDETSPKTKALLPEADRLGAMIVVAYGKKEQAKGPDSEPVRMRDRSYTHFFVAFEEARDQLAYLRRKEGDADKILPSIFASKRGRTTEPDAPSPAPSPLPVPLNGGAKPSPDVDPDSPFIS